MKSKIIIFLLYFKKYQESKVLIGEFENIKSLYFLDKKTLSQIFVGKLTEMIAGGVVSETVSKKIIEAIKSNYPDLLETLK